MGKVDPITPIFIPSIGKNYDRDLTSEKSFEEYI